MKTGQKQPPALVVSERGTENARNPVGGRSDSGDDAFVAGPCSRLEALCRVGQAINAYRNLDQLLPGILEVLLGELPTLERASIHLLDESTGELQCRATRSRLPGHDHAPVFNAALAESAMRDGLARLTGIAPGDQPIHAGYGQAQALAAACVLLQTANRQFGIICAKTLGERPPLSRDDLNLIAAIGTQAAAAIETAGLVDRLARQEAALYQAHQELQAAREILAKSEKLALIGQLSSGIVHQLKNPITVIQISNEMMAGHLAPPDREAVPVALMGELSGVISEATDQCRQVMNRLLLYTRDPPAQRTEADIRSLVRETVELVGYEALRIGATVTCSFADQLPPLSLVHNQIEQVFINIILNALRAMPPRTGRLEITVEPASHVDVPHLRIRFRDNGRAMSPEERTQIFEPFFNGFHRPGAARHTGFGMSVSRSIIQQYGGHILIDSVAGESNTVDVLLPVDAPVPGPPLPAGITARSGSSPPG